MTYLVIRRPYAHLEDEVRRVFGGREDIKVVVDRRSGERRATGDPTAVMVERRRADRRRAKEERAQVARATGVSISMVSRVLAGQVSSASVVAAADRLLAKAALRLAKTGRQGGTK